MPRITTQSLAAPGGILSGLGDAAKTAVQLPGQLDALRIQGDERRFNRDLKRFDVLTNLKTALGQDGSSGGSRGGGGGRSGGGGSGGGFPEGFVIPADTLDDMNKALIATVKENKGFIDMKQPGQAGSTLNKAFESMRPAFEKQAQITNFQTAHPGVDMKTPEGKKAFAAFQMDGLAQFKQGVSESTLHPVMRDALIRQAEKLTGMNLSGLNTPVSAGGTGGTGGTGGVGAAGAAGAGVVTKKKKKKIGGTGNALDNEFSDEFGKSETKVPDRSQDELNDLVKTNQVINIQSQFPELTVITDLLKTEDPADLELAIDTATNAIAQLWSPEALAEWQDTLFDTLSGLSVAEKTKTLHDLARSGDEHLQTNIDSARPTDLDPNPFFSGFTELPAGINNPIDKVHSKEGRAKLGLPIDKGDDDRRLLTDAEKRALDGIVPADSQTIPFDPINNLMQALVPRR